MIELLADRTTSETPATAAWPGPTGLVIILLLIARHGPADPEHERSTEAPSGTVRQ